MAHPRSDRCSWLLMSTSGHPGCVPGRKVQNKQHWVPDHPDALKILPAFWV